MDGGFPILAVFGIAIFIFVTTIWHFSRSRSVLEQWADQSGFEILHSEYRNFARGPYFWTTSKGQTVYYVTVRDNRGHVRTGWVRCGGWFLGLMTDQAEVPRRTEASGIRQPPDLLRHIGQSGGRI
jgi:hypothetical protein